MQTKKIGKYFYFLHLLNIDARYNRIMLFNNRFCGTKVNFSKRTRFSQRILDKGETINVHISTF